MGACSKQEDVNSDGGFIEVLDEYEQAKLMTKDTVGLNIMSLYLNGLGDSYRDTLIFVGTKQEKFWLGIYSWSNSSSANIVGKELWTYASQFQYPLDREMDLGYSEKDTLHITEISIGLWGRIESKNFEISVFGKDSDIVHDKFVTDFVVVRDGIETYYPNVFHTQKIYWYNNSVLFNNYNALEFNFWAEPYMALYSENGKIINSTLKHVDMDCDTVIPVNFEEGIFQDGRSFERVDIFEDKVKWSFNVSGFQEDARLSFLKYDEIGQFWYYQVNATNYDGTKESKILKIDIESGEYWLWMDAPVEDVFIEELEEDKDFALGVEQQLHYKTSPENVYDEGIKVSSSDESIVSIDENMVLRTHSKGKAIITISSGDGSITKKYEIEVKNMLSEVSLIELEECRNLVLGSKLQTHCKLFPEDADNLNVNIHSSDESVVSIEGGTILWAKSKGKAIVTISSEDGNATKSYEVEVDDIEAWIKLSVSSAGMSIGGIYTGSLSCSLVNASHATIHVSSVKIVDGNGTNLYEGGEDLLQDILPNSTSREFSVQINKAYKPKVIWIYEYEGVEYEVVHEI